MPKKSQAIQFRILVVGAKNVGKYSLREQYVKGWISPKDFEVPPGTEYKREIVNNKKFEVSVVYCRDLESIEDPVLSSCDGVVIVYNISDKVSFSYIKSQVAPFLQSIFGKSAGKESDERSTEGIDEHDQGEQSRQIITNIRLRIPVVLAGNKVDEAKLSRAVSTEEGEKLCKELSCAGYFETSATCNENVSKLFICLLNDMIEHKAMEIVDTGKVKKSKCTLF